MKRTILNRVSFTYFNYEYILGGKGSAVAVLVTDFMS